MRRSDGWRLPRGRAMADRAGERGIALVMVLWGSALLALLALGLGQGVRTGTSLARHQLDAARAEALAEGGAALAALDLMAAGGPGGLPPAGRRRVVQRGEAEVTLRVTDEHGRVDLDAAAPALLAGLLAAAGVPMAADGRAVALAGAAPLRTAALSGLPGMTPALHARLAEAVTVHSGSAGVDPYVAPPLVLDALPGLDERLKRELRAALGEPDGDLDRQLEAAVGPWLARSDRTLYRVRVEARLAAGAVAVQEAVLRLRPGAAPVVLEWRSGTVAAE
jgi:general secretion pathway protein K